MKKFLVLATLTVFFSSLFAQTSGRRENYSAMPKEGIISGKIKDELSGKFVEYTTIAVFNQKDSTLLGGTISSPDGSFSVNNLPYGNLYLEASFVGYKKTRLTKIILTPQNKNVNVGTLSIEPATTSLQAAEVVAQRPQVEYKIDKKVISVDQNIVSAGGTAVDVLENTPSVQVDIEGNVALRGSSNFTVLIDGRPSVLKGSEALQQLPASTIQSIEIITNPSAKFESEGSAGIINVIMKKQKQQGVNGIVNSKVSTNGSYGGDFLLNLRKNKINYIFGGNYNVRTFHNTGYSEKNIFNGDTTFYQITDSKGAFHRNGSELKGGLEYSIDSKNSLSLMASLDNATFGRSSDSKTQQYYIPEKVESLYLLQNNDFNISRKSYELALDYLLKLNDKGHQLAATVTYSDENSDENNNLTQDTTDNMWQKIEGNTYHENTTEKSNETELRAKVDYTLPISEKSRFEAGYQADYQTSSDNYRFFYGNFPNEKIERLDLYNDKDFSNIIHALYSTYSNGLGKLFDYQVGLRMEYNDRLLVQNVVNERDEFKKLDLFPSIHLSKQLPNKFQFQASYTRRVDRPRDRELDPFKTYVDPYNVRMGNPALRPEYINSYELNAQKSLKGIGFISLELFQRQTVNMIDHYTIVDTLTNISYNTYKNLNKDYSTGIEGMVNLPLTKWWNINTSVSVFNYQLKGSIDGVSVDNQQLSWDARFNSIFRFKSGTQFQLMGFYRAPTITTQGDRKGFFFTNVGVRQDLFNRKLTLSLQVRDILGMSKFEFNSSGEGFSQHNRFNREARVVTFSLSYKINNYKQKNRNAGMNTNEVEFDPSGEGY